jgi:DNA-binding IclR family transcriptional regulator
MTSRVGSRMSFYATATGKVLISHNLDEEMEKRIRSYNLVKLTENTITDHDKLIKLLKKVKKQGYGEDLEESEEGLTCYAVPIKDISGKVIAGISMSGPTVRMEKNKERLLLSLKETADEVSSAMGYKEKSPM